MKLIHEADELYVPENFKRNHAYFADPEGQKPYMGITSVLSVIAKNALIQWAANEAVKYVEDNTKHHALGATMAEGFVIYPQELREVLAEARYAHRKKKEDAGQKGTDLHALVEEYVRMCIANNGTLGIGDIMLSGHWQKDVEAPNKLVKAEHLSLIAPFIMWASENSIRFLAAEKRLYSKTHWIAGTCDLVFEKDGKTYIGDIKTYKKLWDRVPMMQCAGYALMAEEMWKNRVYVMDKPRIDGYCIIRIRDGEFEPTWSFDVEGDTKGFLAALELYSCLKNWGVSEQ